MHFVCSVGTRWTLPPDDMPPTIYTLIPLLILTTSLPTRSSDAQKASVVFFVDEELPIGARIGSVGEKLAFSSLASDEVIFVPLTDLRHVNFNRTSGLLTVKQRIDRESLCKEIGACCPGQSVPPPSGTFQDIFLPGEHYQGCAITMLVMDQRHSTSLAARQQESPLIQVVIYINDLNDNPPSWSMEKLELEIPEHTAIGRMFQLPEATDPDSGPTHTVRNYRLIPSEPHDRETTTRVLASDAFELSSELVERAIAGSDKFSLGLKVKSDLDREKQSAYYFLLVAIDGGTPQLTGTLSVTVRITDINDQAPYFRQNNPLVEVAENTAVGNQIYTAVALDDDPSDANRLEYRIGSTASAEVQRLFRIDSRNGAVMVAGEIDYESAPILPSVEAKDSNYISKYGYIIPIEVTDHAHIAETRLRVQVMNANDNPPFISIHSPLQKSISKGEFHISEDAPVGTLVATITVSDADERGGGGGGGDTAFSSLPATPYCSTTSNFFNVQPLHSTMRNLFKVVTARPLDHESKSVHGITIICHDSGQPVLSTKQHLTIRLEDVNDSPPVFEKSVYYARISEGLPARTPILKVHASDADTGLMGEVRYRFLGSIHQVDYDPVVLLDEKTGQIRSGTVFDRETVKSLNFTVEAIDCAGGNETNCGGRINSATAEVVVLIDDVNDCSPEFEHQSYEFTIQEELTTKVSVGKVNAIDRDDDTKNNRVRYHINDESLSTHPEGIRTSRLFSIAPTGEIFTNSIPIDREQVPIITFSVVATDSGDPPRSAFATVVIRIDDVNDNGPQWLNPPLATSLNISAYSTVGTMVTRLEAEDPDVGINGEIKYEIVRGNSQKYFDLDPDSGMLYLSKALEQNTRNSNSTEATSPKSFALSLRATDDGEPPRSNTTLLKINVLTIDAFQVDEHSPDGLRGVGKNQHLSNGYLKQTGGYVDRELLVMVVMIIITLLVSVLLIMAIVLLRCRQTHVARQSDMENQNDAGGGVGIVHVAQVKPHVWIPPPSQDSSAKSGFTFESSRSGAVPFEGQTHYMTTTGHFVTADGSTLKSGDGTFGRFSPALIVPQQQYHPISSATTTFQRTNRSADASPTGAIVYTTNTLAGGSSPHYVRQMCATLSNNSKSNPQTNEKSMPDSKERCYMTLNPNLYQIEYPCGQLNYQGGVYRQIPQRINTPVGLVKSTPNILDAEDGRPTSVTLNESVELPRNETHKHCRFKLDVADNRLTPVLGNFDTSESTEATLDGVEVDLEAIPLKRIRNTGRSSVQDTLLVDIH